MANLFKVLKSFFLHKYHQWKIIAVSCGNLLSVFPGYSAPRGPYGRCLDCVPLSDWRVTGCSNDLQHHRPLQAVHQVSLYVFKMWMSGNFFAAGCSHINILLNCICSFSGLDSLSGKNKSPGTGSLPLESVILSLQDLIFYFRPPEEELEHEEKQTKLRSLRNRQNLFQEEVISMLPSKPLALWVQEIISVLYSE